MLHIESKEQFYEEIKNGKVIVDFFATWCAPCRMLSPVLEEIEKETEDLRILKVNVDDIIDLAADFQVSSIPLLLFFQDGKKIGESLGYLPKQSILQKINTIFH